MRHLWGQISISRRHSRNEEIIVFLQEPPRTEGDVDFRLSGIPARISRLLAHHAPSGTAPERTEADRSPVFAASLPYLVYELRHAAETPALRLPPSIVLHGWAGLTIPSAASYSRKPGPNGRLLIANAGPAAALDGPPLFAALRFARLPDRHRIGLPGLLGIKTPLIYSEFCTDSGRLPLQGEHPLGNPRAPHLPLGRRHIAREVAKKPRRPTVSCSLLLMISAVVAIFIALYACVEWQSWWTAFFFGYMGYVSLQAWRRTGVVSRSLLPFSGRLCIILVYGIGIEEYCYAYRIPGCPTIDRSLRDEQVLTMGSPGWGTKTTHGHGMSPAT